MDLRKSLGRCVCICLVTHWQHRVMNRAHKPPATVDGRCDCQLKFNSAAATSKLILYIEGLVLT
jgi:hypothetical protein